MKIFLIITLIVLLVYLFSRRFLQTAGGITVTHGRRDFAVIGTSTQLIQRITKSTLRTVGVGFLLFFIALILGMKIKILWILFPLSLYLMGQLFVYSNHVQYVKGQRIYFNPQTYDVLVEFVKAPPLSFNLIRDVTRVSEVKSVQKNREALFGYYAIHLNKNTVMIPYLIEQHRSVANVVFFRYINENFKIEIESKLFPII